MISVWGSFTFRDDIPSRRSRTFAEIRQAPLAKPHAWDDRHVPRPTVQAADAWAHSVPRGTGLG